jgi:hypothetical protein
MCMCRDQVYDDGDAPAGISLVVVKVGTGTDELGDADGRVHDTLRG